MPGFRVVWLTCMMYSMCSHKLTTTWHLRHLWGCLLVFQRVAPTLAIIINIGPHATSNDVDENTTHRCHDGMLCWKRPSWLLLPDAGSRVDGVAWRWHSGLTSGVKCEWTLLMSPDDDTHLRRVLLVNLQWQRITISNCQWETGRNIDADLWSNIGKNGRTNTRWMIYAIQTKKHYCSAQTTKAWSHSRIERNYEEKKPYAQYAYASWQAQKESVEK